jgi:hypothetical protein
MLGGGKKKLKQKRKMNKPGRWKKEIENEEWERRRKKEHEKMKTKGLADYVCYISACSGNVTAYRHVRL